MYKNIFKISIFKY